MLGPLLLRNVIIRILWSLKKGFPSSLPVSPRPLAVPCKQVFATIRISFTTVLVAYARDGLYFERR